MAAAKRPKDMSFKKYRQALKNLEYRTKAHLRGRLIWNSNTHGIFRRCG